MAGNQRAPSGNRNLEPAAGDWPDHAEGLGGQAAAYVAIQGQPEWIVFWRIKKKKTETQREK